MNDVKSSLFSKNLMDRELTNSNANDGKAEALDVKVRNMKRNSANKSKEKNKFCNYYKKKWHIIDDCWKLQNKENRSFKSKSMKLKEDST